MMNTEVLEPVTGLLPRTSTTLRRDVLEGTEQMKKKKERKNQTRKLIYFLFMFLHMHNIYSSMYIK